jgi:hypothetical protein
MKTKTRLAFIIIVIVALVTVATVSAQEGFTIAQETVTPTPEPTPCSETNVSGTVVGVDEETGTVTIDTGEGQLCTVKLGVISGGHPIAVLLGQFFGNISADSLKDALNTLEICVELDEETSTWKEVECGENQPNAKVISENQDGSFAVEVDGQIIIIFVDSDIADSFKDALDTLSVMWDIDEDGTVHQVSEEIQAYHEDGMGFGVLTKIFAMAADSQEECQSDSSGTGEQTQSSQPTEEPACGVTVQELVDLFKSGTGMGQLFKEYGKPGLLGVGHVRKAAAEMTNGDGDGDNGEGETPTSTKFQGLGRGHGNTPMTPPGLAKKNQDTSTETTVQEPSSSSSHPGKGKGPAKDNPGKGNGKGKSKGKGKP